MRGVGREGGGVGRDGGGRDGGGVGRVEVGREGWEWVEREEWVEWERECSEVGFSKIQDGGRPTFCISIFGHNFGVDQHFCTKFCIKMENGQPKKIQDGGRPPFWISILAHKFRVDQYFRTKFGTEMENRQPKGTQCSEIRF